MKFELSQKDYRTEIYKSDLGNGLEAIVSMLYHTQLKYWDVAYHIKYPPYYRSEHIFGKEYISSRKDARKIALKVMSEARPDDWKTKLSDFYQKAIRESMTPNFMRL